jgi:hypothetical protein
MGPMKNYLLDSNIAIAILLNEPETIHFIQIASREKVQNVLFSRYCL